MALARARQHRGARASVARPDRGAAGAGTRRSQQRIGRAERPLLRAGQTLAELVDEVERSLIAESLDKAGGNIAETARTLGLTRRGLYLKLKRLGIESSARET